VEAEAAAQPDHGSQRSRPLSGGASDRRCGTQARFTLRWDPSTLAGGGHNEEEALCRMYFCEQRPCGMQHAMRLPGLQMLLVQE